MEQDNQQIRHIKNDRLETIKQDYRGNKTINGRFANGDELYNPPLSKVLRWQLTPNPQREQKKHDDYTPPVKKDSAFIGSDLDMVVWLGHASFLIRLGGVTFLTDPVLYDLPMIKRRVSLPCEPEALRNIDFLLLSHAHRDHLDKKSVQTIFQNNPQVKALAPLRAGRILRSINKHLPYQEAGWFQKFDLVPEQVEVYYMPARHWHRRGPFDMNKILWGSFVLKTPNLTLYFAGDTAIGPHFEEIEELFGPMDVCIMPVGAYKPAFLMHRSHMDPHEAVKAYNLLRGGTFIPMHYGTFDLSDEPPGEPVRLLEQIAAGGMLQGLKFPAIGEPILL
ncbi:L-ascorbate metabolism protein UlaG (beta-lactamase superfamily) [Pontibacter ummariensis]|uniref:L-ascorbate metabolism protein UlaG, beta-lactamase superfamily n=1 Tax=Pontibacter ummariensis TaxID=1610492 RepID=A0A239BFC4_9BACT|nr:MBL fold metallo-hydrolase [Pontibacter ummariensis]PRY16529.1 L-ascorbate metabolism protein UlaG (beta-lactamase superfamily) [Pontibacter ummariensis]SNS06797.1 L-ascorbate metabolism protein UlaG, beta-lactamase superfamily [Pontibacter ummariensis]